MYTDYKTWSSSPLHQMLWTYREKTGIDARLIVVAMTAESFPMTFWADPGMLGVAGLDSAVPNLVADLTRGL